MSNGRLQPNLINAVLIEWNERMIGHRPAIKAGRLMPSLAKPTITGEIMKRAADRFTLERQSAASDATSSWALLTMALVVTGGLASPAFAADPAPATDPAVNDLGAQVAQAAPSNLAASSSSQTGSQQATPPAGSIGNGAGGIATYTVPPPPPPPQNPYALADTMKLKGWILPIPGAADTLDQGFFGVRNALAQVTSPHRVIRVKS